MVAYYFKQVGKLVIILLTLSKSKICWLFCWVWTSNYFADFEQLVTLLLVASRKVGSYFAAFEQVKNLVLILLTLNKSKTSQNSLRRNWMLRQLLLFDYWLPKHRVFWLTTLFLTQSVRLPLATYSWPVQRLCYLRDVMPRQRSLALPTNLLPRVLRIWEGVFYFQTFFTLHSFLLLSRPPQAGQFTLKGSRASCWSLRHSPGPTAIHK